MLGRTGVLLERYLDLLTLRQRVTSSNIANADTPGYRAREVDFRQEVLSLLNQGLAQRPSAAITVREVWGDAARNDGNNVSLERELGSLADTQMRFGVAALLLQKKLRGLKSVIQEGRGG